MTNRLAENQSRSRILFIDTIIVIIIATIVIAMIAVVVIVKIVVMIVIVVIIVIVIIVMILVVINVGNKIKRLFLCFVCIYVSIITSQELYRRYRHRWTWSATLMRQRKMTGVKSRFHRILSSFPVFKCIKSDGSIRVNKPNE